MKKIAIISALLLVVPLFGFSTPVPDTGQIECYDTVGNEIKCPSKGQDFYGQDANYAPCNPHSYTKLDGSGNDLPDKATEWIMVRDNVTGLMWEVKTDDGFIHDKDNHYNWYDAQDVFIASLNNEQYGGFADWRLPTVKELSNLLDSSLLFPSTTLNTDYFPNASVRYYWSSTGWIVLFGDGVVDYDELGWDGYYVRAVRGGQFFNNFIDNGDGTVTDTTANLMWQQDTAPSTFTWQQALSYCENLTLAGYDDWRLPNRNELHSIVDYNRGHPSIDPIFSNAVSFPYWSSTTPANRPSGTWNVLFRSGGIYPGSKSDDHYLYVRAVRGGQCIGDTPDCKGDFDCDTDCDGTDAEKIKNDFGRSPLENPCESGNPCNGDFDCDNDCDGTDAFKFKEDFGRSSLGNPCPACVVGEWCVYP